jgi:galacturan 1,4-alpha-galacturonidase
MLTLESNFYYDFQRSITFWKWGGDKIKIYGSGTLNGNGQAWYNGFAGKEILDDDNVYYRPILFLTDGANKISIEGIEFLNSPCWTNFLVNTNDISFDNVRIEAVSNNAWDTYNVKGISVTNSRVNIGDDCFSPKPNTSDIFVKNLWCNGTHGVSMGSIGQYAGTLDYIENAYIENVTMLEAQNGARLKAWAGPNVGYGYIRNITFKDFEIGTTDWPIVLDQCYFNINSTTCAAYPSRVNMTDIVFENFRGSSSGKNGKRVAKLTCSPAAVCENITLKNIELTTATGEKGVVVCDGIKGGVGVPCVPSSQA